MKTMLRSLFLLFGWVAFVTTLSAQQPEMHPGHKGPHSKEKRTAHLQKMAEDLGLTETQKTEFLKLHEEFGEKAQAVREEAHKATREKMEGLRTEKNEALKDVLDQQQYEQYLQKEEEHQKRRQERRMQHKKGQSDQKD